ncbi:hypothetical protein HDU67_009143, partial [Dinochytrium kinnereticum]
MLQKIITTYHHHPFPSVSKITLPDPPPSAVHTTNGHPFTNVHEEVYRCVEDEAHPKNDVS